MLRVTIRELLLLTLVVTIVLGWWIDRSRLATALADAEPWRGRASALEHLLTEDGWNVKWSFEREEVTARWPSRDDMPREEKRLSAYVNLNTALFEPSSGDKGFEQ